jgi:indole-3-glycerol phosphate synthase/phosphoribosylanthranilate isomerase
MALAAEFKRASPSKGDIAIHVNVGEQAMAYALAGANIISVLTELRWFKGTLADMTEARLQTTSLADGRQRPAILRKEFVTETYQIAEAAAAGADTILLIVAVLPQHVLRRLIDYARDVVGMEPLVEVHGDAELDVAIEAGAKVVGVNNRNLHTFQLDLATSQHVAAELTKRGIQFAHNDKNADYSLCALSGMSNAMDVQRYRQAGLGMCLIGESLMRAADPAAAIASLCLHPDDFEKANAHTVGGAYTAGTKLIKVCGNTTPEDALTACQEGANLIGVIFAPKSKRCVTPDQAKEIVQAVRKFGERTQASLFPDRTNYDSPLRSLVDASYALQEAARRPLVVGVFQNQEPEFIRQMVFECGLDMVQLHGKEGMEAANVSNCGAPAIRVVDIETDPATGKATSNAIESLLESLTCDPIAILLDTSIKGNKEGGGTGVTFDWTIAEKIQNKGLPVIIAGGLTPDNVKEAVASVRPWGVDVSSGVEESPGKKDREKVQDFIRGAKEAAKEASKGF